MEQEPSIVDGHWIIFSEGINHKCAKNTKILSGYFVRITLKLALVHFRVFKVVLQCPSDFKYDNSRRKNRVGFNFVHCYILFLVPPPNFKGLHGIWERSSVSVCLPGCCARLLSKKSSAMVHN